MLAKLVIMVAKRQIGTIKNLPVLPKTNRAAECD
jgi:hypothetical protein